MSMRTLRRGTLARRPASPATTVPPVVLIARPRPSTGL